MANIFSKMLANLTNLGFYDFVLPWLMFLAIIFGLLQNKKTISEDPAVNGVISIVAAFFIAYIARGMFYTQFFGIFGGVIAVFLILIISLAMFGIKPEEALGSNKTALSIGIAIIILMVFIASGAFEELFKTSIDGDTVATVLILIALLGAAAFIGGGGKD
ncbi:MAG: hypothetical protein ABIF85_01810 [Nanoarchaeota archaeon]|nr:hypothetical protein [Nanoarchaeota archaeon]MBU4299634.1 hypothetical protein [Nanoarchaeota archaeon]MBU4452624.1 hypothetical protein [Nanoarchaeota archaeon]MCG2723909.1 hypothetical protein [archaeon]